LWAVNLHNRIQDFLPRFRNAQVYGQGCALVFTIVPFLVLSAFQGVFKTFMSHFSRREELLVDQFAASLMQPGEFAPRLVRALTLIKAFDTPTRQSSSLASAINAAFHCDLMSTPPDPQDGDGALWPNYFDLLRRGLFAGSETINERILLAHRALLEEPTPLFGSHPSLSDRIRSLGESVAAHEALPLELSSALLIDSTVERTISAAFATHLRPAFYKSKLDLGMTPTEGLGAQDVASYTCRYPGCSRKDKVELIASRESITLIRANRKDYIPLSSLKTIEVDTGGNNFFVESGRAFTAVLRGIPTNRKLTLRRKQGGPIEFEHWHFVENAAEVEAVVLYLWKHRAAFATV
jgi:hypothetical protein